MWEWHNPQHQISKSHKQVDIELILFTSEVFMAAKESKYLILNSHREGKMFLYSQYRL